VSLHPSSNPAQIENTASLRRGLRQGAVAPWAGLELGIENTASLRRGLRHERGVASYDNDFHHRKHRLAQKRIKTTTAV